MHAALLVAVLLRIVWAVLTPVSPVSDSAAYDMLAWNLASGDGFGFRRDEPNGFFAPGAPFIYAAVYAVFGHAYWPIVALHILVGVGSVSLLWTLANGWFGKRAADVAAWILAIWPSQIMFVTVLATELLFNFLLLAALWIWTRESLAGWIRGVLLGPVLALCALVRPHALLLPVCFALARLARTREWVASLSLAGVAGVLMLVVILPWSLRNERAFGEPVLIAANFGSNLWMGNNPASGGAYMDLPDDVKSLNDAQRDKALKERAINYILDEPAAFARLSLIRLLKTHGWETINIAWNIKGITQRFGDGALAPLKALSTAYWYVILLAALSGMLLLLKRDGMVRGGFHPTILLWGYFATVHAVTVSQDRYHFISIPLIAALAGLAIACMLNGRTRVELPL